MVLLDQLDDIGHRVSSFGGCCAYFPVRGVDDARQFRDRGGADVDRRNARRGARASRPTRRTGGRGTGTMLPGGHDPAGRMESRGSWPGLAGEVRGQGHRALRATSAPLDSTPNVVAVTYV